ncbi:neuropeptides B/W receptor type 1 [Hydra vulgaris]|uniref:Neuropeptides B/W receptor type 1 n=1 Tax=Hydra vulgaris TaxID=6087 RepID=A0ABM4B4Q2_HYDVU
MTSNLTKNTILCLNKDLISEKLLLAALTLILVTGVTGNAFVIYVFGCKRKSSCKSTTELLILCLGITDLLSSFFNPSLYIYWTITNYCQWDFGYLGCHIVPSIGPIMTSISSGLLLIFAIDRYIAVVTPFRKKLTRKKVSVAFILDILLSVVFYLHYLFALKFDPKLKICYIPNASNSPFYGTINCISITLRLSLFATIFSFTNIKIYKTSNKCSIKFSRIEDRVKRLRQSKKVMIVLLTMGVVFILLVFPRELFFLGYNLKCLLVKDCKHSNPTLTQINSWLKVAHTANSCANVFIYSHMHTKYRKEIIRTLSCFGSFKKTFPRRRFSFVEKKNWFLLSNKSRELTRVLTLSEEDLIYFGDAVFFQRAQKWKIKK